MLTIWDMYKMTLKEIDPDLLRSLYVDQRLSRQQIASRLGVSSYRVIQALQRNGIRRTFLDGLASKHPREEIEELYVHRGLGQAAAAAQLGLDLRSFRRLLERYGISGRHKPGPRLARKIEDHELRRLYIDERRKVPEIAVKYGCSGDTIRRRLKKLGLYKPPGLRLPDDGTLIELHEKKRLTYQQIGERYGVTSGQVYKRLLAIGGRANQRGVQLDAAVLRRLYVDERLTQLTIAVKLGVSRVKVWEELRRHGISRDRIVKAEIGG